jgi:hypothetical protein
MNYIERRAQEARDRMAARASERAVRLDFAKVLLEQEGWSYVMVAAHPRVRIGEKHLRRDLPGYQWSKEQQVEAAVMARQLGRLPSRLVRTDINLSGSLLSPQWKEKAA